MIEQFYLNQKWDPTDATTAGQSGPESNDNEEVLNILQILG